MAIWSAMEVTLRWSAIQRRNYAYKLSDEPEALLTGLVGDILRESIEQNLQDMAVLNNIVERYESKEK